MKKIMFMTNTLYGGGAEKVLQTILRNINYEKYDVTLYSMHREPLLPDKYPPDLKYRVVFDTYRGKSKILQLLDSLYGKIWGKCFQILPSCIFYRLFIWEKYDVEVAFIEGESTKIISGSPNKSSKKLAWVHVDLESNPWTDFLFKSVVDESNHYRRFDRIICVSNGVRKAFLNKYFPESVVKERKHG